MCASAATTEHHSRDDDAAVAIMQRSIRTARQIDVVKSLTNLPFLIGIAHRAVVLNVADFRLLRLTVLKQRWRADFTSLIAAAAKPATFCFADPAAAAFNPISAGSRARLSPV